MMRPVMRDATFGEAREGRPFVVGSDFPLD